MAHRRHATRRVADHLDRLLRRRHFDLLAAHASQRTELALIHPQVAGAEHDDRLLVDEEAEAFENTAQLSADDTGGLLRRGGRDIEALYTDLQPHRVECRPYIVRGQGFYELLPLT